MPRDIPFSVARLEGLAAKYGTPLQIYDEDAIRDNARHLLASFEAWFGQDAADGQPGGGYTQFFAVKALPNPAILRILVDEGMGLDCSSRAELWIANKLGVDPKKVMYTSNFTSDEDLAVAFDQGVIINLDDISLVDGLVRVRGRCPELISFRLNPGLGRTDSKTKSNVLGGSDAKFGVPTHLIVEAYRKAQAAGASRFGIHMMTGSCVLNNDYWLDTISVLLKTVGDIHNQLGISFEFINIGGGLGVAYAPDQQDVDLDALVPKLKAIVKEKMPLTFQENWPKLCMENGRYVTGPFGYLVSRCESVKETYATFYGLDACMANLMRPGMYGSYHHISVPTAEQRGETEIKKANVVGTLCENNDWFAKQRSLPKATRSDLFVIHDTGAHSHSMGFQYNGKLRAPEVLVCGGEDRPRDYLIRARECIEDLFNNTRIPDYLEKPARTS